MGEKMTERDCSFYGGILAALDVVKTHANGTAYGEIVVSSGIQQYQMSVFKELYGAEYIQGHYEFARDEACIDMFAPEQ